MSITIIAAVSENGVIGKNNKIPWHIPEDLKRFKALTMGHIVLMGRKTLESIIEMLGHPLLGRTNIVITRNKEFRAPRGVEIYHAVGDALAAHQSEEIFVIGGSELYAQMIGMADRLYITHVSQRVEGDAHFPEIKKSEWRIAEEEKRDKYSFSTYTRIKAR